jgi:hypothetical protein
MKTLTASLIALGLAASVATAAPFDVRGFDGPAFGPADVRSFDGPAFGPSDVRSFDGPAFGPSDIRSFDGPARADWYSDLSDRK